MKNLITLAVYPICISFVFSFISKSPNDKVTWKNPLNKHDVKIYEWSPANCEKSLLRNALNLIVPMSYAPTEELFNANSTPFSSMTTAPISEINSNFQPAYSNLPTTGITIQPEEAAIIPETALIPQTAPVDTSTVYNSGNIPTDSGCAGVAQTVATNSPHTYHAKNAGRGITSNDAGHSYTQDCTENALTLTAESIETNKVEINPDAGASTDTIEDVKRAADQTGINDIYQKLQDMRSRTTSKLEQNK